MEIHAEGIDFQAELLQGIQQFPLFSTLIAMNLQIFIYKHLMTL